MPEEETSENSGNSRIHSRIKNIQEKDRQVPLYMLIPNDEHEVPWDSIDLGKLINKLQPKAVIALFSRHPRGWEYYKYYSETRNFLAFDPAGRNNFPQEITFTVYKVKMYAVQFHNDERYDSVQKINVWNAISGFQSAFELPINFDNYFKDMKPFEFSILTNLDPATIWLEAEVPDPLLTGRCLKKFKGPLYQDFLMLSKMIDFTFLINPVVEYSSDDREGWRPVTLPNTVSKEITRLVDGDYADIVGGDTIASYDVFQVADISAPVFYQSGANIVSIEPLKSLHWYALFQPFSLYVWVLILSTVPICGTALYIMRKFSRKRDKPASLGDAVWDIAVILCWECVRIPQPSIGIGILMSSYMLACLTLVAGYLGSPLSEPMTCHSPL